MKLLNSADISDTAKVGILLQTDPNLDYLGPLSTTSFNSIFVGAYEMHSIMSLLLEITFLSLRGSGLFLRENYAFSCIFLFIFPPQILEPN